MIKASHQLTIDGADLIPPSSPRRSIRWNETQCSFYKPAGTVDGSTTACQSGRQITDTRAFQWILEHEDGFDVSNLSHLDVEKIKIHEPNTR